VIDDDDDRSFVRGGDTRKRFEKRRDDVGGGSKKARDDRDTFYLDLESSFFHSSSLPLDDVNDVNDRVY